ncbi:MAG: hypothetical protein V1716_05180 [Candidatus Uhrbacteria bacterium]
MITHGHNNQKTQTESTTLSGPNAEQRQAERDLVEERWAWSALATNLAGNYNDQICKGTTEWRVNNPSKSPALGIACDLPDSQVYKFKVSFVGGSKNPYQFEFVPTTTR